jgi:hypothetical protein
MRTLVTAIAAQNPYGWVEKSEVFPPGLSEEPMKIEISNSLTNSANLGYANGRNPMELVRANEGLVSENEELRKKLDFFAAKTANPCSKTENLASFQVKNAVGKLRSQDVIVCFQGMMRDVDLNGTFGKLLTYEVSVDRWVVELRDGLSVLAKGENLVVVSHSMSLGSSVSKFGGLREANVRFGDMVPPKSGTVIMRNTPNNISRDRFVELLIREGFQNLFDLVYLPRDFRTKSGLGYAFVNLVSKEKTDEFIAHFTGFSDWDILDIVTDKVCEVDKCRTHSGLRAQIERLRNSPVMHESVPDCFKPILLQKGERVCFPKPTRPIGTPQYWKVVGK